MVLMLVIADDLTGAADCGVACAVQGLETKVVLGDSGGEALTEALSIDGDTRRLPANEAATETARLLRRYLRDEGTLLYKKLDSTMRGNVWVELAAILDVRRALASSKERIVAVLAPAFPATGRTTVNGRQLINGEPLKEQGLGPDEPVADRSDIAAMLRAARLRRAPLGLDVIRGGGDTLRNAMKTAAQDSDVLVCDAETDDDLRKIAEASVSLGRGTVWAGSGGLARQLLPAAGLSRAPLLSLPLSPLAGPPLFVVGSGSRVSHEQVEYLASKSDTIVMEISHEVLLAKGESPQWRACGLELEGTLIAGKDVAVLPDHGVRFESETGPQITKGLATLVRPFADIVGALVVTGGETARAVFEEWEINSLRLVGEVEAGLPFSVTSGWRREMPVITKAGGFGGLDSLLRCRQFLRGQLAEVNRSKGSE